MKNLFLKVTLTLALLAAGLTAFAQSTVRGTVKDASGQGVVGASVFVQGTHNGAIVDVDGSYSLSNVQVGDKIEFSCIGYTSQVLTWNGGNLNVVLAEDSEMLEGTVVNALGIRRDQKALGYAVTEMKGDELSHNVINPVSALQGKVAGVEISGSDGGMFGSSKIIIRGASTLSGNNQPIYVVDGVILDNAYKNGDADWSQTDKDWGNELKNLNPDDFETVSILKGAAATALYGSRGLNGAVVITTKSGRGSRGLGVSFSQTVGVDYVYGGPRFQNEYGEGYLSLFSDDPNSMWNWNYLYEVDGVPAIYDAAGNQYGTSYGPKFDGRDVRDYDDSIIKWLPKKNNFREAFDLGWNTNTNVSVQGGNETTSFYTSMSYKYSDGTTPNNTFNRLSLLAKASHKITDWMELEAGINFANSKPRGAVTNLGEKFIDGTWSRLYDSRYWRTRYQSQYGGVASASYGDEYGYAPGRDLWFALNNTDQYQKETSVRPNLKLTVTLTPWLKWVTEGNYNYYYIRSETKELGPGFMNEGGSYRMGLSSKEQTNLNTNLMFNKSFGTDWNLSGFVRGEYYHNFLQNISMWTNGGLVVPGQYFIGNSKDTPGYDPYISGEKTILSLVGQAALSWRNQVFLEVTGRNDWSSSLVYADGHGNYSYFYPSVSASWIVSDTFRDSLPDWMSFLKVRASWAQVGNDTDAYRINTAYSLVNNRHGNDGVYGLEIPNTIYATDLRPERKNSWEVGIDWRFFNNRIGIDATYYKENTTDQIMTISIPSSSGYSNQLINAGNIQNSGLEIALNTTPVETRDFSWDLNFVYTKNASKIISLHENVADFITLTGMAAYGNYRIASTAKVNGPYGVLMTDNLPKVDEKTGMKLLSTRYMAYGVTWYERSGKVEELGSMLPKFLGGINTTLRYKDLSLRVQLDARFGGKVAIYGSHYGGAYGYLETSLEGRDPSHGGIAYTSVYDDMSYTDGIIPDGGFAAGTTLNSIKGGTYTVGDTAESYQSLVDKGILEPVHASAWNYFINNWGQGTINDTWVGTLNYIALREVALSYRLPERVANSIKAKGLSVTLAGRNLGYLLNSLPNKFNPESLRGTQASQFMIRSVSPYTANFTATVNISF